LIEKEKSLCIREKIEERDERQRERGGGKIKEKEMIEGE
jgi:hypothetical protein